MRGNNVLGIIFPNVGDEDLSELTTLRSMGSVPFGGRYRLIDFPLSAMVECGMSKIGIVTKSNYQSLMDHVGSGRAWDLSRKNGGLMIIPPFNTAGAGLHSTKLEALSCAADFLSHCDEEYILLCDCNVVCNIDLEEVFDFHQKKGADITVVYTHGTSPEAKTLTFSFGEDDRITGSKLADETEDADFSTGIFFMRKALLERLANNALMMNETSFENVFVFEALRNLKLFGYKYEGYFRSMDNLRSYFEANMSLLDKENRHSLFKAEKPIYTKNRDDVPAIYGLNAQVKNSLVTDGCVIEGTVENCLLSHGVHIGKGAVVKNSIIMNNSYIGDGVKLDCVIADKEVVIKPGKTLCGDPSYPVFIGKKIVI